MADQTKTAPQTEGEQGQPDQNNFDSGWDEANGKTPVDPPAKTGEGGTPPPDPAPKPGDGAGGNTDTPPPADPAGTPAPKPGETASEHVSRKEFEDLLQKTKSWEGRLGASARENETLKRERDELAARLAKLEADSKSGAATPAETDAELAALEKEYPDYTKKFMPIVKRMVEQARKAAGDEASKQFQAKLDERVKPLETNAEKVKRDAHFKTITDKHPDYAEQAASQDMQRWIGSRPAYLQNGLRTILQKGSAEQVNGLLDDFKQAMKDEADAKKRAAEDLEAKRKQQAKAAGAVSSRTGGVPAGGGQIDENDFDAAWEQATKKA